MKDLSQASGLPIKFEDIGLTYDQNIFPVEAKTRTYDEAKDVYLEKGAEEQDLYWMYRYFEKTEDEPAFKKSGLEYDITVLKPGTVGSEFIKTAGHYHGYVPGTSITYPEVYEVIDGMATYLLQTKPDADDAVEVVVVQAKAGDKVIIPPNYGHITINTTTEQLVESNIQKENLPATADYETFKIFDGAALYDKVNGWTINQQEKIKSLKTVTPKEKPEWGLIKGKPLYTSFIEDPKKFKFLTEPQNFDFSDVWREI